jgi:biopolymer transport protein ExbD
MNVQRSGRRGRRGHSEVSTGALTDIMFFLMLFFLIAGTLTNPSVIRLLLPKASNNQSISKQSISVSITKDLAYFVNNEPVQSDALEDAIREATKGLPEATVIVRADEEVPVKNLVAILDIGNKLKIKMLLATRSK